MLSHDLTIDILVDRMRDLFQTFSVKAFQILYVQKQICDHSQPVVVMANNVFVLRAVSWRV
jgi:uncharacterized Fe-S cluster protein YjdI